MVVMGPSYGVTAGRTVGVVRLVLLGLTLAGVVAMHGLASIDATGVHRSAVGAAVVPMVEGPAVTGKSGRHGPPAMGEPRTGMAPGAEHDGHELMAGCVGVLLGLLAAIGLRVLGRAHGGTDLVAPLVGRLVRSAPRGPPQPIFLALCVVRR
jgi:hypothetical protein